MRYGDRQSLSPFVESEMPETCFQDKQGYTPRLGQSYVSIPSFGPEDRAAKKQGLCRVLWQ